MTYGKTAKNVYFTGIGGVSMSGLAAVLRQKGVNVAGSDDNAQESTRRLAENGCTVHIGHAAAHITDGIDLVVYSAAVAEDNPELIAARQKGIPAVTRARLLGDIIKDYDISIAVSGVHGKTTTTAMIADILLGRDPTVLIGGDFKKIGGNYRVGGGDTIVFEACEYTDSFLEFFPHTAVILNIEADHPDYFKDLAQMRRSFAAFAGNVSRRIIINAGIHNIQEILAHTEPGCKAVTFGVGADADYRADNIEYDSQGRASFDITAKNGKKRITSRLTGAYNIENAAAAYAAVMTVFPDTDADLAARVLSEFTPAARRFEIKGVYSGATVADDYAHHPTAVREALKGAAKTGHKRVLCVFQPHTYTRTLALFDGFAHAFADADEVGLVDIYAAREKDEGTVSSERLARAVSDTGKPARYFASFGEAAAYYKEELGAGDLFITMGAGDVYKIGDLILGTNKGEI